METLLFWIAQIVIKLSEMVRSEGMVIYSKELELCFYTKIRMHAPVLHFKETIDLECVWERYLNIKISLDTCVRYTEGDFFKSFEIKVLGFGFSFIKQTGY